jgi:hypothetical protein
MANIPLRGTLYSEECWTIMYIYICIYIYVYIYIFIYLFIYVRTKNLKRTRDL